MPHFTTTDNYRFRSYLLAHGVNASSAEKVASKIQRKSQRRIPLTKEETTLLEGYMAKKGNLITGKGADVAHKVNPGRVKFDSVTLKKGYVNVGSKISPIGNKISTNHSSSKHSTRIWGDPHINEKEALKVQKISAYAPGMIRQLAYKVAAD